MKRHYQSLIEYHLNHFDQMIFLAGPRQVGKTTISQLLKPLSDNFNYLNWDIERDRALILRGETEIGSHLNLNTLRKKKPIVIFDEIHKYPNWKQFLKGYIDLYKGKVNTIVTGSSQLDLYQKSGDSLMGRYFLYRIHPLSVSEIAHPDSPRPALFLDAKAITQDNWETLLNYGGFPEPFIKRNTRFSSQWHRLRRQQLFYEDIRTLTQIQDIKNIELLAELLKNQVGGLLNMSTISNKMNVPVSSISRWIATLESFYYCFTISPWSKNISRSLIKDPKLFLWDWSALTDIGKRNENIIASHLLKAVHYWTDTGKGEFGLHYLRTKEKKEVDFIVTKDSQPLFMVEVKTSEQALSPHLIYFKERLNIPYAFQVTLNLPFEDVNCFETPGIFIVSAQTFLSQI